MTETRTCPECAEFVERDSRKCVHCGARLGMARVRARAREESGCSLFRVSVPACLVWLGLLVAVAALAIPNLPPPPSPGQRRSTRGAAA